MLDTLAIAAQDDYQTNVALARECMKGYSVIEAMERTNVIQVTDEVADEPWEV